MISSSSGMLPAWLCLTAIVGVSVVAVVCYFLGFADGCHDERSARIQRACDRFDKAPETHRHPLYHVTRYATIAELMPRIVEGD